MFMFCVVVYFFAGLFTFRFISARSVRRRRLLGIIAAVAWPLYWPIFQRPVLLKPFWPLWGERWRAIRTWRLFTRFDEELMVAIKVGAICLASAPLFLLVLLGASIDRRRGVL